MELKKVISSTVATCAMAAVISISAFAASKPLHGGGATWSGGINSNRIIYSKVVDNKKDNIAYKVTVWVKNDKGAKSEKTGTTSGKGDSGKVQVTRGATYLNPFAANTCGYKDFKAVSTK